MKNYLNAFALFGFLLVSAQYEVGSVATDFSLKNVDNKMVSLADYPQAKGFIVIFTCNHCPYSIAYEDRIIALSSMYKDSYPVIAINPNDPAIQPKDSFDLMQVRAKEKGFNFPYLIDSQGQKTARRFGASRTPHVYLLNKENEQLIVRYIGAIDNNYSDAADADKKYVENAVNALLAGKEVPLSFTRAIGCSVKQKE